MNRVVLAMLAVAAGGVAHARPVATGASTSVDRQPPQSLVLYRAYVYGDQITIQNAGGPIAVGDRYDLVDEQGFLASVEIDKLSEEQVYPGCQFKQRTAIARLLDTMDRPPSQYSGGQVAVIGPSRRLPQRDAKVLRLDRYPSGVDESYAVDLDGDKRADLRLDTYYESTCADRRSKRHYGARCHEALAQLGDRWKKVYEFDTGDCY